MSISVTKVAMSVADLTDDVVADIMSDAAAGHDIPSHKVVALCAALGAQRRGMRNIINVYAKARRECLDLQREATGTADVHAHELQLAAVRFEVARRHALKLRKDMETELQCAIEFEAALEAVATLARLKGATEADIDEAIMGACDDVS